MMLPQPTIASLTVSMAGESIPQAALDILRRMTSTAVASTGIGASVKRREDLRLRGGQGPFPEAVSARGQLYAAFVRSPHAHADVLQIDAEAARAVDGVFTVFTGRDLVADGIAPIPTLIAERGGGIRNRDETPFAEPAWHPLAADCVGHVGGAPH